MTVWCSSSYYQSTLKYNNAEITVNKQISQIEERANLAWKGTASGAVGTTACGRPDWHHKKWVCFQEE